jgi:uncharacterized protein (DUF486 family)
MERAATEGLAGMHPLVVFSILAFVLFRAPLKWNMVVSYLLVVGAVFFAFKF